MQWTGHEHFRTRLVLSMISGKAVKITGIRSLDKDPGLRDYEVSLLRLLEKISNGSVIEISHTGTAILLKPGVLTGGPVVHDCPLSRSIGYFLEPIVALAPFSKKPLMLTLRGITTDEKDLSVDLIRTVTLPHLAMFGVEDGLEMKIKKRGSPPGGGGEIQFISPVVKSVKTLNFLNAGKVKRIRGIAHAVRVSPQFSNRMVDASRSILNRYIPDLYIHSDVYKGEDSGKSPGYALSLLAETTEGALYCSEAVSSPRPDPHSAKERNRAKKDRMFQDEEKDDGPAPTTPEDVALKASRELLVAIQRGGCVDRKHQWLVLLYMVLGSEDVGRVRMGQLSARSIQFLRDVKTVFGTSFKISAVEDTRDHGEIKRPAPGTGITVHFNDSSHHLLKTIEGNEGDSLLDLAHEHDIDMEGACEGSVACSTCHVILPPEYYDMLEEPEDDENDMLDMAFGLTDTSRLGCQVKLKKELDGMVITLPSATRNFFVDGAKPTKH